jgi:hypothetical protein
VQDRFTRTLTILTLFAAAIIIAAVITKTYEPGEFARLVLEFPFGLLLPVFARLSLSPEAAAVAGWIVYSIVGAAIVLGRNRASAIGLLALFTVMLAFNVFVVFALEALKALR